jgi:hypothetical protein
MLMVCEGVWAREERGGVVFARRVEELRGVVVELQEKVDVQVKVATESGEQLATAEVKGNQANGASTDGRTEAKRRARSRSFLALSLEMTVN